MNIDHRIHVRKMINLNNDFSKFSELRLPDGFPVAMAYVKWQKLGEIYQPDAGLERGTLFPDLDKPFMGMRVNGGNCKNA